MPYYPDVLVNNYASVYFPDEKFNPITATVVNRMWLGWLLWDIQMRATVCVVKIKKNSVLPGSSGLAAALCQIRIVSDDVGTLV